MRVFGSRWRWFAGLSIAMLAGVGLVIALAALVPELEPASPDYSVEVLDRQGELLRLYTNAEGRWRLPVDSARVDPRFIDELLSYEDKRFHAHPGVDALALIRAMGQWLMHGEPVSGASTITMQAVRLVHPRPRTLRSKFIEMVQALRLERRLSKKAILDLYLTLAPYGGNLVGLRAATRFYFDKEPARLTPSQRALLIALPQSPVKRRPDLYPEAARLARDHVLRRLLRRGKIAAEDVALANRQPIPARRGATPRVAAHLADRLRRSWPHRQRIETLIDGPLQRDLEQFAGHWQAAQPDGVTLAVMVVDHRSGEVVGYLGSGGFLTAGQLDLVTAVRSPGSTLKPFVYGLGFERNLIHPETRLLDRPQWLGEYGPRNFDSRYRGEVSIREALLRSLNTPAVQVLAKVGPLRLERRFEQVGVTLRAPRQSEPGLPAALGGVGITLEELTRLYAALGQGGRMARLRFVAEQPAATLGRLLSPTAAWYLDDILVAAEPPEGFLRRRPIRFKTGTSHGFRDAWSIGYDSGYAVGVWVGRPDGGYSAGLIGMDTAAPILHRLFPLLPEVRGVTPPPADALLASHEELPLHLKWFGGEVEGVHADRPEIRFPVDGSVARLADLGDDGRFPLMVEGGKPPFQWLVDGEPVAAGRLWRHAQWLPEGPGLARVTVIDGVGRADRAEIWVE